MLVRIVRMEFKEDKVAEFLDIFNQSKLLIRSFAGCNYLELYCDALQKNVFFTLSKWESEQHLEEYRKSELFKQTWAATKILFDSSPKAFSLSLIEKVGG